MALTEQDARDRLTVLVQPDTHPRLTSVEFGTLVRMGRRADSDGNDPDSYGVWNSGTGYITETLLTPTTRNGFVYRCSVAGVSGAAQPTWPTTLGATVGDGAVTWVCHGRALWVPTWDLNYAAAEGWQVKAGKAAGSYSFSDGSSRYERNQVVEHCLKMRDSFRAGSADSIQLQGPMSRSHTLAYWERVLP